MEEAPADESPVGTVPQTADSPDDIDVADNLPLIASAATQREIDVIAKPSSQRYVPTAPEFGDTPREVREVEVAH